jgi:hypothetical protein
MPTGPRARLGGLAVALALLTGCVLTLRAQPAGALVLPLSLDQLTVRAGVVVRAHVVSVTSRWQGGSAATAQKSAGAPTRTDASPSASGAAIVTDVRLRVDELLKAPSVGSVGILSLLGADLGAVRAWTTGPLKDLLAGDAGTTVTITVPGGSVGGWDLQVEDAAAFQNGAEHLVFLSASGGVVGWRQGNPSVIDGWVPAFGRSLADVESRITELSRRVEQLQQRLAVPLALASVIQAGGLLAAVNGAPDATALGALLGKGMLADAVGLASRLRVGIADLPQLPALDQALGGALGQFSPLARPTDASAPQLTMTLPAPAPAASGGVGARRPAYALAGYPAGMNAWMVRGPIDLSGVSWARLSFRTWYSLALGLDRCAVAVSVDGKNFYGQTFGGSSQGWELYRLDLQSWPLLGDLRGRSRVWLAFAFESDLMGSGEGAYIDDVTLASSGGTLLRDGFEAGMGGWRGSGSPTWGATRYRSFSGSFSASCVGGGPQITGVRPDTAAAGIGAPVTITGSGFGARQGHGHVDFFYKSDEATIRAPVLSWSDGKIVCSVPIGFVNRYPGSAASGPLTVTTGDGSVSAARDFKVTYGWGQVWWPAGQATFYVAAQPSFVKAVRAAAQAWNQVGSPFRFVYGGKAKGGTVAQDFRNELIWTTVEDPSIIAYACPYTYHGCVVEVDQVFNSQYQWGDGSNHTMDVQTICVHEMGHWLSLRDLYGSPDRDKCMYGFGDVGWLKRAPTTADREGILWIYARAPFDVAGPTTTPTAASVRAGRRVTLRFRVDDPSPSCGWAIAHVRVRDAGGATVYESDSFECRTNAAGAFSFLCRLSAGAYSWQVVAKDMALHDQVRSGTATLTVE